MPNTLLTPEVIAKEGLMILTSSLVAASLVYRDYEQEWTGAKVGDTVTIRKPPTFVANEFTSTVSVQNITEGNVPLRLEKHYDVTVQVTSRDWTLAIGDFASRVVRPAMVAVAEGIDRYVLSKGADFPTYVGTAGTGIGGWLTANPINDFALVDKQLNIQKVPQAGRYAIVDPTAKASIMSVPALVQAYSRGDDGTALREASMGRIMGIDYFMDQNIWTHTKGTAASATVTSDVAAGATTIPVTVGGSGQTFTQGDLFTVAGAPGSYVVTAAATASGTSVSALSIYPPVPAGGFAATSAITIVATNTVNFAAHPNAIALAIVPLELPRGAAQAAYMSDGGVGIRVVYGYDTNTKTDTISFDVLCGAKVIQPELGTRILG